MKKQAPDKELVEDLTSILHVSSVVYTALENTRKLHQRRLREGNGGVKYPSSRPYPNQTMKTGSDSFWRGLLDVIGTKVLSFEPCMTPVYWSVIWPSAVRFGRVN